MKNKIKNFIMNPWTVSVGSGLVVLLVTVVIDIATAERIFSTIKKILVAVWTSILSFLNFEIKVWWLLIGIGVLVLALWVRLRYLDFKQSTPAFLEYTQDTILGYKWKWTWEKDYWDKYCIEQLHPICPNCDTPLVDGTTGYGGRYICLRCNNGTNKPMPDYDNVKMIISDNVRRRFFPND